MGCDDGPTANTERDAAPDATTYDMGGLDESVDMSPVDATPPDATPPDATPLDAEIKDAEIEDAAPPDAEIEDADLPDTSTCASANDCLDVEACVNGACGTCLDDVACGPERRCLEGFCLPHAPPIWDLHIDPQDFRQMVADPFVELYVPCSLHSAGVDYAEGCEVRLRGGSSREYPKKSFRVRFPSGAEHPGFTRKINLRAEYNDPSFLRTVLAYETVRRLTHLPTPRIRYIELLLNGAPYGLFTEVERVSSDYLDRRGISPNTPFYEADPPHHSQTALGYAAMVPLPEPAMYEVGYDKKAGVEGDYRDLIHLVEDVIWSDYLDTAPGQPTRTDRIREAVDVPAVIDYLAILGLLQSHDHVRKNYLLAFHATAAGPRWAFYPWDLDLTFGCLWNEEEQDTICDDAIITDDAFDRGVIPPGNPAGYPVEAFYNLLIHQVLNDPELRTQFEARMCAAMESVWWTTELRRFAEALRTHIRPAVERDPNRIVSELDNPDDDHAFDDWVDELLGFVTARPDHLRGVIECPE